MLELVNLSNAAFDTESLLHGKNAYLEKLLQKHGLDGIEMMFCEPWDKALHLPKWIKGVHLRFWSSWMDFWREDNSALLAEFGSIEKISEQYGALQPKDWLEAWRRNVRQAAVSDAAYVVFHVAQARTNELYTRQFTYSTREVIEATAEVVNEFVDIIPKDCWLLFENLWWPGLTLQKSDEAVLLLSKVRHKKSGFMLDTGHMMNTNLALKTENEGIDYILATVDKLGDLKNLIKGVHLHQSLSGAFVKQTMQYKEVPYVMRWQELMDYIIKVDQHQPFHSKRAGEIIDLIKPEFLVHEFIQDSYADWDNKICKQRQSLGWE